MAGSRRNERAGLHVELVSTSNATAAVVRTQHVTYILVTGGSCVPSMSALAHNCVINYAELVSQCAVYKRAVYQEPGLPACTSPL